VTYEQIAGLRRSRRGRSLFFIDLAVPRDVDPKVEQLDGTFLYNIDDFSRLVAESLSTRQKEAELAEELVLHEVSAYERWIESEQATPTIVALRRRLGGILQAELERSTRGKLKHLDAADREALAKMTDAALNKMLHIPTMRLRALASDTGEAYRDEFLTTALVELFGLDQSEPVLTSEPETAPPPADAAQDSARRYPRVSDHPGEPH
jgi:glutamyl-tRNA reductase